MRYVIIGNGPAGVSAIEAIRKVDGEGEIVNINGEPYRPYSKPLLPFIIGGTIKYEDVFFRPPDFYDTYGVKPILGEPVIEIDVDRKLVVLASGRRVAYDKLLIATGGKPREPKIKGLDLEGIYYLTSLVYVEKIMKILPRVKHALILGGGPLGLKAALSLAHHSGIEVSVLVSSPHVMSQVLDAESASLLERKLVESGVKLMTRTSVVEFRGNGFVKKAILDNGDELPADLVIIGKGVTPALDFIDRRKIRANVGIIVDGYMQTSVPDVYAAGDVAESYDILTGGSNTVAVWPRASEQGHYAGLNMAGFRKEYIGAHRMNSLDFEGVSCIVMGDVKTVKEGYKVIVERDIKRNIYQRIILENGRIRGAAIIGRTVNVGGLNRLLRRRIDVENIKSSLLEDKATFIY